MSTSQAPVLHHPTGELEALAEVAKALASPLELPELLDAVMQTIVRVVHQADVGAIMLWNDPAGVFRPAAAFGYDLDVLKEIGLRSGESITGKVFDDARPVLLGTPAEVAGAMADMRPFNREVFRRSIGSDRLPDSAVAVPITAGNERFGVLVLEALGTRDPFTQQSLPFVQTLADLIALRIDRERLQARADAVREARRADRMRSEVMATLSHELRMLLVTIKGYATALQLDEVAWSEAKRQEFLRLIEEACDDMESMIQDILDSSLIEVDQLNLERQPLRLAALAREIASEVECRSPAHRPVVDFPSDFPLVEGDPRWIKQAFRNILDNAVKYSPDGGLIVIQAEARPNDVVVSVSDQGIGISSEDLIPLFEKFFRVRSAATLHISGTGLGLPIARAIIEAHGGRIWVESKQGEGTTIFFSLPRFAVDGMEG
jgi:K+-sensing histidine kinase KdpD